MKKFTGRRTAYRLIIVTLVCSVSCQSYEGIVAKQYYEPPQTVQYVNERGKVKKTEHDDADYCLDVVPVNQAIYRMRRQEVPRTKLYVDFDRWKSSHHGDTISYTRRDRKD